MGRSVKLIFTYGMIRMKKKPEAMRKPLFWMLLIFVLLIGKNTAAAADNTVKIHIGDSDAARHHMAIAIGGTSAEYRFTVKGYEVKTSSYTSSNDAIFRIISTSPGKCKVIGVKEGTGMLTLTIKTTDGTTLKERVFISVYTKESQCQGVVTESSTPVYRGASDHAGVENEDKKGTLPKDAKIIITGICDSYYYFKITDGTVFVDDSNIGFIQKSRVRIPVTGVVLSNPYPSCAVGETICLNAEVQPALADQKEVTWSSSNPMVAVVNDQGEIKAKKEGNAVITVTTADGGLTTSGQLHVTYQGSKEWNISNTKKPKIKTGKMTIKATATSQTKIKVTWKKQKKVKYYVLYRAAKKSGKYKKVKKIGKKKTSYTDQKLKAAKKYYYRLLIVKTNGKKLYSKKANATTRKKYDAAGNRKYFQERYHTVCLNANQNMNQYSVDGYYSSVKYQFDGKCLQIHLYLDFVTYENTKEKGVDDKYIYRRSEADRTLQLDGESYVNLFLKGLKRTYDNVEINGSKNDLSGKSFCTKLVVHDRKSKESYHENQNFVEVMIGGECPNCELGTDGTYWYHEFLMQKNSISAKQYYDGAVIYMPTQKELYKNQKNSNYYTETDKSWYLLVAGHEMGHVFGLNDAYIARDRYTDQLVDRCNENYETCKKVEDEYDNIMVENDLQRSILPNDLEMMLEAYQMTAGRPWLDLQSYKTYYLNGYAYYLSTCIRDSSDKNPTGTK